MHLNGLYKAIRYFGSQQALAKAVGVKQQMVSLWINRSEKIPTLPALKIFAAVRGHIPLNELMADSEKIGHLLDSVRFFQKFSQIPVCIDHINTDAMECPIYKDETSLLLDMKESLLSRCILIDTHNQLITCSCRVRANLLLKNKIIYVHKIHLPSVISGDISITPLLHTLPVSEKVAVGLAIERELGRRQGKRTDLELPQGAAEVKRGIETRQLIANIIGLKSHFFYGEIKFILNNAIPSLIHHMDQGEELQTQGLSLNEAIAAIAEQRFSSCFVKNKLMA